MRFRKHTFSILLRMGLSLLIGVSISSTAIGDYVEDEYSLQRFLPSVGAKAWLGGRVDKYDTLAWLGVPFAAPPVGDLRWRPPQLSLAWDGIRDATSFGDICPQLGSFYGDPDPATFGEPIGEEDCLYLNVWRPNNGQVGLPVLFWIHGGSNVKGAGSEHLYNGAAFAKKANAVVVTVNYRLGSLGWFYNSALFDGELEGDSGNFATLDLIKSLTWVKENIAQFGGDSESITLAGHSAGCINAWGLLRSPMSEGLIDRMLCMSGLPMDSSKSDGQKQSDETIDDLLVAAGHASSSAKAKLFRLAQTDDWIRNFLRALPANVIVRHSPSLILSNFVDGQVLRSVDYSDLIKAGQSTVPMILGHAKDEGTLFVGIGGFFGVSDAQLWDMVNYQDPATLSLTDVVKPGMSLIYKPAHKALSMGLSFMLDNTCRDLSPRQEKIYRYSFNWDNAPQPWPRIFGAFHGVDISFLLGNFLDENHADLSRVMNSAENESEREALSNAFIHYVAQFMRTGDPNLVSGDLPEWPQWSNTWFVDKRLIFDSEIEAR